tara:strand:- start:706 stop:1059 length:354 start_codon:yes stop_codon:yes gene_type:complete
MTPEQQRIAIAEACGWGSQPAKQVDAPWGVSARKPDWQFLHQLPDYLNSLDAMHEAEKVLNAKLAVWYLQKLTQVRYKAGVSGMIACMIDKTVFATASQRAEAFLRTIGKWEEGEKI